MTGLADALTFLAFGAFGGFMGSILGIGGGSLTTPLLLAAGYDILVVVPASLLAMVGTSIGGLYVYDEKRLIHFDTAVIAESLTVPGSITGVLIASAGYKQVMKITLTVILLLISFEMLRAYLRDYRGQEEISDRGNGSRSPIIGFASMYFAGLISALAGVGGGILKVPILRRLVGLSMKEAVATSKLMVGITGAAAALAYFMGGLMDSCLALSLLAGSLLGGFLGSKTGAGLSGKTLTLIFSGFMMVMAIVVLAR